MSCPAQKVSGITFAAHYPILHTGSLRGPNFLSGVQERVETVDPFPRLSESDLVVGRGPSGYFARCSAADVFYQIPSAILTSSLAMVRGSQGGFQTIWTSTSFTPGISFILA